MLTISLTGLLIVIIITLCYLNSRLHHQAMSLQMRPQLKQLPMPFSSLLVRPEIVLMMKKMASVMTRISMRVIIGGTISRFVCFCRHVPDTHAIAWYYHMTTSRFTFIYILYIFSCPVSVSPLRHSLNGSICSKFFHHFNYLVHSFTSVYPQNLRSKISIKQI